MVKHVVIWSLRDSVQKNAHVAGPLVTTPNVVDREA
jgi:hypothetical protein